MAPGFNCCMKYNNSNFILQIRIEINQSIVWDSIHLCKEIVNLQIGRNKTPSCYVRPIPVHQALTLFICVQNSAVLTKLKQINM